MIEAPSSCRLMPDNWLDPLPLRSAFPRPEAPIEADIGCGKGRFLLARARRFPEVNFLGIERLLGRLRKVDRKAIRAGLSNVRLLRMEAFYATRYLIPDGAIRTYYIFFPDPWPKARHHDHRLCSAAYMDALARTLQPGGAVHVATDHLPYFEEIARTLRADRRYEEIAPFEPTDDERTDFELLYLGRAPIGRCSFRRVFSF